MNALTIPEVFSNIDFYKENYLSIISDSAQYYTEVENAHIHVWPIGEIKLHLGDLLQLWFSEKWLINSPCQLFLEDATRKLHREAKQSLQRDHDLYLYQLEGSALSGSNRSKVWSESEQKSLVVSLDSVFKYYCIYKGTDQPIFSAQHIQPFKSAV